MKDYLLLNLCYTRLSQSTYVNYILQIELVVLGCRLEFIEVPVEMLGLCSSGSNYLTKHEVRYKHPHPKSAGDIKVINVLVHVVFEILGWALFIY
ncbi:hypothetical protein Hdeb2414_s0005g00157851 [Helianthus debilis subsp. tardiflorus]